MILTKEQVAELLEVSKPLIKFLNEFHPHVKVIVESDGAEFLEASARVKTTEFIKD